MKQDINLVPQGTIQKVIGNNVKRLRAEQGLTIEDCAERAGISTRAFSEIEHGRAEPRATTLMGLSVCFDVSIDSLYEREKRWSF